MKKNNSAYKTIGEVAKSLGLINDKNGSLSTHTIRFWEKEFKQIKPKIFTGKRRYYDKKSYQVIKNIKYLLKDKGMTIKGVKNLLSSKNTLNLDEITNPNISDLSTNKNRIFSKIKKINEIVKELKKIKNG
tara:strand:- start:108 stop:500 length:393 start_codon:yes stop_codon:yes gene_type:complete